MAYADFLDSLYAATLDQNKWAPALHSLCAMFNATAAHVEVGHQRDGIQFFEGVNLSGVEDYAAYYRDVCPRFQLQVRSRVGEVTHDGLLGNEAELDKYEFYSDFLAKQNLRYHVASTLEKSSNRMSLVAVQRSPKAGEFSPEAIKRFSRIIPHLQRALSVSRQLASANSKVRDFRAAMERHPLGLILIGDDRLVQMMNPRAEEIVGAAAGLQVIGRRLRANPAEIDRALSKFLRDVIAPRLTAQTTFDVGTTLSSTVRLRAIPLPKTSTLEHFSDPVDGSRVLITLTTAEATRRCKGRDLCGIAGLSPAEAELCATLLNGETVTAHAMSNGLSVETVRTYMKQVRRRLGCSSQSEVILALVGLI